MFRSKGFTTAFVILSVLIVALLGIFIYLVVGFGKSGGGQETASLPETDTVIAVPSSEETDTTTVPTETEPPETTPSETETEKESETAPPETEKPVDRSVRALNDTEEHLYPIVGEVIPEYGSVTVVRPGDAGEGIVFHALPQFDDAGSDGNIMRTEGSYDVKGKIFIIDNDRPYLMYETTEDLFVTSAAVYIAFTPAYEKKTEINQNHLGSYGNSENYGISASVFVDDGNHVAFSLFNYDSEANTISPVLSNVIAQYDENGKAHFEYHNSDGKIHEGTLSFRDIGEESGFTEEICFVFDPDSALIFKAGAVSEMWLHH